MFIVVHSLQTVCRCVQYKLLLFLLVKNLTCTWYCIWTLSLRDQFSSSIGNAFCDHIQDEYLTKWLGQIINCSKLVSLLVWTVLNITHTTCIPEDSAYNRSCLFVLSKGIIYTQPTAFTLWPFQFESLLLWGWMTTLGLTESKKVFHYKLKKKFLYPGAGFTLEDISL